MEKRTVKESNVEYYQYLEELRKSGKTNMYGATPYLIKKFDLDPIFADAILREWIDNYEELSKRFNW